LNIKTHLPVVLTLDAGGTNFVFSAMKDGEEIVDSVHMDSSADDLQKCIKTLKDGFREVISQLSDKPEAISFAFPGPADYPRGIIGDLPNLPAFRGGVPLGPKLSEEFKIPVFINNDGNLFTMGEYYGGMLPSINNLLKESGSTKKYENLIGVTLGTGFGGGLVVGGNLIMGDNSNAGEFWSLRNKLYPQSNVEESIGSRALSRKYCKYSGTEKVYSAKDLFEIAIGIKEGNKEASLKAFAEMAMVLGDTLANLVNIFDGLIVMGGGISSSHALFMDVVLNEMNGKLTNSDGSVYSRMISTAYNLEKPDQIEDFIHGGQKLIDANGLGKLIYNASPVTGIGISKLGTNRAISLGAYFWAVRKLAEY